MIAICHDCQHKHKISDSNVTQETLNWLARHQGHNNQFITDKHPGWLIRTVRRFVIRTLTSLGMPLPALSRYTSNADVKIAYAASATITIAPENVATSSTFTAGVESAVIDNTSNKYVDVHVGGKWTVGTTPTINTQALIYVFSVLNDTPDYPDVFDGTSSAETLTSAGVGRGFLKLAAILDVDSTTSNRVYDTWFSVAQLFGGAMPLKWGLFITHNTGVNSNSTAGNHVWKYTGVTYTVI